MVWSSHAAIAGRAKGIIDMKAMFFGLGYSSRASARALQRACPHDLEISGTTRNADKSASLILENIKSFVFDPGEGRVQTTLPAAVDATTHLIHSIAPGEDGDVVLEHFRDRLMASDALKWMCYYSTVGVYGNFDGAWIDETAPCQPVNQRSQWRVKAEDDWRAFAAEKGIPLVILRLAGIYGPGRSSFDKLRDGKARRIIKPGQVFNRIHVSDIARVTALAAIEQLNGTYNLADDFPAPPQDLVTYAASVADLPPPPEVPFDEADMTPMARSFYNDNKRVSNAAIKKALGIELLFPTYREGLKAIHAQRY